MFLNKIIKVSLAVSVVSLTACSGGSSETSAGSNCGVTYSISGNASIDGRLEINDCEIRQLDRGSQDDSFVDEYLVTLNQAGTLGVSMQSNEIDPFLFLLNSAKSCASGCGAELLIAENDDISQVNTNAFISIDLDAGTYLIVANSYDRNTGSYTLETSFE